MHEELIYEVLMKFAEDVEALGNLYLDSAAATASLIDEALEEEAEEELEEEELEEEEEELEEEEEAEEEEDEEEIE